MYFDDFKHQLPDIDEAETEEWMASLDQVVAEEGQARARFIIYKLLKRARQLQVGLPPLTQTRYINTISPEQEPEFPGDEHLERRIRRLIRWNAVAMVLRANTRFTGLGGHMSEDVKGGTIERVLVRNDIGNQQPGSLGSSDNWRPADLPSNVNPKTTKLINGNYAEVQHGQPYAPAIDANGDADCETGQNGYLTGPLPASGTPQSGRYPPANAGSGFNPNNASDPFYLNQAGGSHNVVAPNTPGLAGKTYTGVPNLRDVP